MSPVAWILKQPARQRRFLAVAVIPLAALLLWLIAIWPIVKLHDYHQERRNSAQRSIARDRGVLAVEATIREQLRTLGNSGLWSKLYETTADNSAVTVLQADVGSVLSRSQLSAQSITPLSTAVHGPFERIGVRITVSMSIDQLQQFLSAIRGHPRLIRVDGIAISAPQVQSREQNPLLTVSMDLFGYQWQPHKLVAELRRNASGPAGPGG